jgi:hypothetical protein
MWLLEENLAMADLELDADARHNCRHKDGAPVSATRRFSPPVFSGWLGQLQDEHPKTEGLVDDAVTR